MSGWSIAQEGGSPERDESGFPGASSIDVDQWLRIAAEGSPDQRLRAAYAPPDQADRDRVVPALMTLAGDIKQDIRSAALYALGELGDQRSYALIRNALDDRSPRVREAAVWAANKARIIDALPEVAGLFDDRDPKVRVAANWYFAQTVPPAERGPLLRSLEAADSRVRVAAVWGLSASPLEEHRSAARFLFADSNPDVREAAAWGFAEARDSQSIGAFRRGLADRDEGVRKAMADGLQTLGDPGGAIAIQLINGEELLWSDIESALGSSTASSFLIALLDSDENRVRNIAAAALGQSGENAARTRLLVMSESQRLGDRMAATAALSNLDNSGQTGKFVRLFWSFASSVIGFSVILLLIVSCLFFGIWRAKPDTQ